LCWMEVHYSIYLFHFSLSLLSPDSWNSSKRYQSWFLYMCIHYLHHIHPLTPFSAPPFPQSTLSPTRLNLFCSPVLQFHREKKIRETLHFC
jgi:hypothetical protein